MSVAASQGVVLPGNRPASIRGLGDVMFREDGRQHDLPPCPALGYVEGRGLLVSRQIQAFDAISRTDSQNLDDRLDQSGGAYAMLATEQLTERSHVLRSSGALAQDEPRTRRASGHGTKAPVLAAIDYLRERVRFGVAADVAETASPESLKKALVDAEQFVKAWPDTLVAKPDVGLADDGEVNFFWKHRGTQVDLGFFGDGTYSYFAKDRHGERYFGDDLPAADGLARELLHVLVEQA